MVKLKKIETNNTLLFISMMLYKFSLEWGYKNIIHHGRFFNYNFDIIKYIIGTIWITVLFFSIKHNTKKVSVFCLYFVYIFQIIPITVIYAFLETKVVYITMYYVLVFGLVN